MNTSDNVTVGLFSSYLALILLYTFAWGCDLLGNVSSFLLSYSYLSNTLWFDSQTPFFPIKFHNSGIKFFIPKLEEFHGTLLLGDFLRLGFFTAFGSLVTVAFVLRTNMWQFLVYVSFCIHSWADEGK